MRPRRTLLIRYGMSVATGPGMVGLGLFLGFTGVLGPKVCARCRREPGDRGWASPNATICAECRRALDGELPPCEACG